MNSAPACIILEQLGARGVELQGGRGGGEEEGELRKQPYQCWNGFAVGDVELLVWEKRNYSSFHPTLVEGFFSSSFFIQLQNFTQDWQRPFPKYQGKHEKGHMVSCLLSTELPSLQAKHVFEHLPFESSFKKNWDQGPSSATIMNL